MKSETRDKIREAARRQCNCGKYGGRTEDVHLDDDGHFPGLYRVCPGCGYEKVLKLDGEETT